MKFAQLDLIAHLLFRLLKLVILDNILYQVKLNAQTVLQDSNVQIRINCLLLVHQAHIHQVLRLFVLYVMLAVAALNLMIYKIKQLALLDLTLLKDLLSV